MSSTSKEKALEDLVADFSNYASLRNPPLERQIDDNLDDLSLRMDEFSHSLEMCRGDASNCLFKQLPKMAEKYQIMQTEVG